MSDDPDAIAPEPETGNPEPDEPEETGPSPDNEERPATGTGSRPQTAKEVLFL